MSCYISILPAKFSLKGLAKSPNLYQRYNLNTEGVIKAPSPKGGYRMLTGSYFISNVSMIWSRPIRKPKAAPMISTKRNSFVRN